MFESDDDFSTLDTTSDELLASWQNDVNCECRVIRSHRKPRTFRARPFVVFALAVASSLGIVHVVTNTDKTDVIAQQSVSAAELSDALVHRSEKLPPSRKTRIPYLATGKPQVVAIQWSKPLTRIDVTSCWGPRDSRMHKGVDFRAPRGTNILAVGAGKVVQSGWNYTGLGYSVVIDHGNGWMTLYGHASKLLVRTGQRVTAGQPVALVGSTGHSTGNHLHLGVAKTNTLSKIFASLVNPAPWLHARDIPVGSCA